LYTQKLSHCYRETFTQRGFYTEIAAPKPDLGAKAKKKDFGAILEGKFRRKITSAEIEKIC